jgi:putative ABC transport system permease protein
MISDYFKLALKNLRHRGIRSWLTLLGIFIGVSAVILLISLGSGLERAVVSQFGISDMQLITIQAGGISGVGPPGAGAATPLSSDDVKAIDRISTVEVAFGRIITFGRMEYNNVVDFVGMSSIPMGNKNKIYEIVELEIERGRLLRDDDTNKVILGNNFYTDTQKFGRRIDVGSRILINEERFEVVGIAKKRGSFFLDNIVLMNDDKLRDLVNYGDREDIILAKVRDQSMMERAKEDIERVMRSQRGVKRGEENFQVSTPEATLNSIRSVLGAIQAFVIIIASISIIVGAIGIANTMTTSVLERKKEIGIMKAVGAKNSQIFFQFLIESGTLGLVGGMLGIIFGMVAALAGIYALNAFLGSTISMDFNLFLIFGALAGTFAIGSLSGIIPAMNAAKQNPVEALRG